MYTLSWTPRFARQIEKFRRAHPELKQRILTTFDELRADPFEPRLRLHPLHGELEGQYAVSITHRYRLTLTLRVTEREIVLLDIGAHDDVYRR